MSPKAPEDFALARRLDVNVIDERDRPALTGIEAAPEDFIANQIPRLDAELFEDGGPQLLLGVVEGKP